VAFTGLLGNVPPTLMQVRDHTLWILDPWGHSTSLPGFPAMPAAARPVVPN
jgi:hypothetical protein